MGPIRGRSVAGFATACLTLLACAGPASATVNTYTVSSFSDTGGSCSGTVCPSLRVAVQAAASNPGSTVQLGAGTYTLSSSQLQVIVSSGSGYAMTIAGAGQNQTIIEQTDGTDRVMLLDGGPYLLKNLEVTGGNLVDATSGSEDLGGGIYANANLSLDHVAVTGNTVTAGPGAAGSSPVAGGNAFGGGIAEITSKPVTILDSTIAGNRAVGGAGGDGGLHYSGTEGGAGFGAGMSLNGSATIVGSTFSANTATGGAGGGSIALSPANGGGASGGAILFDGTLDMVNSTVTQNAAIGGTAGIQAFGSSTSSAGNSDGGGVDTFAGPDDILLLYSDTLAGNSAGTAGNLYTGSQLGTLTLNNTVFTDGVATEDPSGAAANCEIDNSAAGLVVNDEGPNFEGDAAPSSGMSACDLSVTHQDLFGSSAKLAALADNGGATQTMFPQSGSPLLRAGGSCLDPSQTPAVPLTTDQRGEPRGAVCDIGAVQVQAAAATGLPTLSGTAAVGQTLSCSAAGIFTGEGLTITYAWLRNGNPIGGQTGTSYALTSADAGTTVSCSVTATAIAGAPVTVSASETVPAAPAPPTTTTTSTPTSTPASTPGTIKLLARQLIATAGKVTSRLRCVGGTRGCTGTLRLTTVIRHRTVRLASGAYRINSGVTRALTLKLSAKARALLASHHKGLSAKLTLAPSAGRPASSKVTIKQRAAKRRKKP